MDPTPPPPPPPPATQHSSSSGAGHYSSSARRSMTMSSAALMAGSHYSHPSSSWSHRRSSMYPPPAPLPSRLVASSGSSSSSSSSSRSRARPSRPRGGRSKRERLYEELCEIRSQSADYIARLDAIVADQRARDLEQRLRGPTSPTTDDQHHQSSSPSWQKQKQNQSSSATTWSGLHGAPWPSSSKSGRSRLDLTPPPTAGRNIISAGYAQASLSFSSSSSSPAGYYAASPSSTQHHHQQDWPSSSSSTSRVCAPHLLNSRVFFAYAPSSLSSSLQSSMQHQVSGSSSSALLSPMQQDHAGGSSSSTAMSGFAAFAHRRPSPTASSSRHQQQQQLWNSASGTTDGFLHRPASSVSSPAQEQQQHDVLPPLPSTMQQMPPSLLLPVTVKQEPVNFPSSGRPLEPELICIDDDVQEPVADLDSLLASLESCPGLMASLLESSSSPGPFPLLDPSSSTGYMQQQMCGNNGSDLMMSSWGATRTISGQTQSPMPEQVVTSFGMMSIHGSSSSSVVGGTGSMAWSNCQSSYMPMSQQQQVPWQGGAFSSLSSDNDLSPHWHQSSPQSDTPHQQFMQPTLSAGLFEISPLPQGMDMGMLPVPNDSSTSSARDVLQYGNTSTGSINWNAAISGTGSSDLNMGEMQVAASSCDANSGSNNSGISNMPCGHGHSSSTTSSISMPKLRLGGMESQRVVPPMSPSPVVTGACNSMLHSGANDGSLFTDAEMERLKKDKRLSQLVNTNPKRVKRLLGNRECSARMKARKENCIQVLECQFKALQVENLSLSSRVMSEQVKFAKLKNENIGIRLKLQQLEDKAKTDEAESEALQAEIESLKLSELSGYSNDVPGPMSTHTGR